MTLQTPHSAGAAGFPDADCGALPALLLDELAHGVLVVSARRRILHANQAARRELDRGVVLGASQGELKVISPADANAFQRAVDKALIGRRSLISLAAVGADCMLAVLPLPGQAGAPCERIALFSSWAGVSESGVFASFARHQGLTPTEEQVLVFLCRSLGAPDIAIQMNVAVSTVRSHVRSLCAKTGSSGVRALVNRVATLPPLAPVPPAAGRALAVESENLAAAVNLQPTISKSGRLPEQTGADVAGRQRAKLRLIMSSPPAPSDEGLYAHLSPELRTLALRGVVRSYPKKTVVINEADIGDSLFVLLKGSVKVFSMDENAREITYGRIHSGDYFGEMSFDGGPRSASVITLEPCTCAVLSRQDVSEHLADEPGFAIHLLTQVIRRARAATEAARNMALLDVYGRLAAMLEEHDGVTVSITAGRITLESITHQDIASRIGSSREMVSRLLKDLEKGGYVEMGTKRITLLKKLPSHW